MSFDDGTPITRGSVVFNSEKESFFGIITSDGHYSTGGAKEIQGIPDGVYTVWLSGTEEEVNKLDTAGNVTNYVVTQTVAMEYTSASRSPLRFEVKKGGSRTFDIKVERAGQ